MDLRGLLNQLKIKITDPIGSTIGQLSQNARKVNPVQIVKDSAASIIPFTPQWNNRVTSSINTFAGNPSANNGNNFWTSPVAKAAGGVQNYFDYMSQNTPKVTDLLHIPSQTVNVAQKFNQAGQNFPTPQYGSTGYKILNSLSQFQPAAEKVLNTAANIPPKFIESTVNIPTNLVQGSIKAGTALGKIQRGEATPQEAISGFAQFGQGILNLYLMGRAKGVPEAKVQTDLWQAIKSGTIKGAAGGAKLGAEFGALGGLQRNEKAPSVTEQFKRTIPDVLGGAGGGAILGGALGGFGAAREFSKQQNNLQPGFIGDKSQLPETGGFIQPGGEFVQTAGGHYKSISTMANATGAEQDKFLNDYIVKNKVIRIVPGSELNPGLNIQLNAVPTQAQVESLLRYAPDSGTIFIDTPAGSSKLVYGDKNNLVGQLMSTLNDKLLPSATDTSYSAIMERNKRNGIFDQALYNKDWEKVKALIPNMPPEYVKKYASQIPPEVLNQSTLGNMQGSTNLDYNLSGYASPKDVTAALKSGNISQAEAEGLGVNKSLVERMQQSERYPEQLRKMLDGSYIPSSNEDVKKAAKYIVFKDPALAEQRALNPQNVTDQAVGIELFNHYMDSGDVSKANQILNATSGTNEGQMVQILSQYDKTTPSGAVKFAKNIIDNYNELHPTATLDLNNNQIKDIYSQANKIQAMPVGRERNVAAGDLINKVNDLVPSSVTDKLITVWKAGLLTSFRTHERNIIGNSLMETAEVAKDVPASFVDSMLSKATGERTMSLTTQGMKEGAGVGLERAKDLVTLGFDPSEDISKYDVRHVTWGNNPVEQSLKKYTDVVFRTLAAADKPFWNSSFARSLYDQAGAEAMNAGEKGNSQFINNLVNTPTENMLKTATIDANYATFHDQNALGKAAVALKQSLSSNDLTKLGSEIMAPFTGVPTSIVGKFFSYSPAGLIKGLGEAGQVVASQVPDLQRQASQDIGRGTVGSALFALGAYLAQKGLITGNPKDLNESRQWELEHKSPNSVLVDGKWRSINSIGPQNLIVLAGAKAAEEMKNPEGSLGHYGGSLGKDILNQTFLAGVQGPLNAITDPYRYGTSYVGGQAASVIPNIVKDTSKAFDPNARENNSVTDYLKSGIPGLRNTLTPRRDVLGKIIPQEPTGINAYFDLFNSKAQVKTPLIDELSRLNDVGNNATPSKLGKSQTINGVKQTLTPDQLDVLESAAGPKVQSALQQLIETNGYQNLTDEDKSKAIDNIVSQIRKQVKVGLDLSNPIQPVTTQVSDQKYILVNPDTGSARMIDLASPIPTPKFVGVDNIDKKLTSEYKSAINKRQTDLIDLYQSGQITKEKLIEEVAKLDSLTSKSPKKIKVTIPKTSFKNINVNTAKVTPPKISAPKFAKKIKATEPTVRLALRPTKKITVKFSRA